MDAKDERFDVALTQALEAVQAAIPLLLFEPAKGALDRMQRIQVLIETPRPLDDEAEGGSTLLSQPETVDLLTELEALVRDLISALKEYPPELGEDRLRDLEAAAVALAAERTALVGGKWGERSDDQEPRLT
jgi:hypothetical protein